MISIHDSSIVGFMILNDNHDNIVNEFDNELTDDRIPNQDNTSFVSNSIPILYIYIERERDLYIA